MKCPKCNRDINEIWVKQVNWCKYTLKGNMLGDLQTEEKDTIEAFECPACHGNLYKVVTV